jgi:hypothetical protein
LKQFPENEIRKNKNILFFRLTRFANSQELLHVYFTKRQSDKATKRQSDKATKRQSDKA